MEDPAADASQGTGPVRTEILHPKPLPASLVRELKLALFFASPGIRGVEIEPAGTGTRLDVEHDGALPEEELRRKVEDFVRTAARGFMEIERVRSCDRSDVQPPCHCDAYPELLTRGWALEHAPGVIVLSGPPAALLEWLERRFREIASRFDADPVRVPAMIPIRTLRQAGYFTSSPHYLTLASHLREDGALLRSFIGAARNGAPVSDHFHECVDPDAHAMSPALCYHVYPSLAGTRLAPGEMRRVTLAGDCFRYESGAMRGLERLWDFSMREVVFVGDGPDVDAARMRAIDLTMELVDELGLQAHVETASDPFFVSEVAAKTFFQLTQKTKYELRLYLPGSGGTVAAASYNYHQALFGTAFDIATADGQPAHSACVGFGFERWVLAILEQYGVDPEGWPEPARRMA